MVENYHVTHFRDTITPFHILRCRLEHFKYLFKYLIIILNAEFG